MEVARRRCSCLSAVSCGVVWCRVYRVALEVCVDWCGRGCTAVQKERASVWWSAVNSEQAIIQR